MATGKRTEYGESSIKVLKGLEPVKQRPGMYTLTDNPLHIIQEVIDMFGICDVLNSASFFHIYDSGVI